jgi:hypothetical protein
MRCWGPWLLGALGVLVLAGALAVEHGQQRSGPDPIPAPVTASPWPAATGR